jgi:hypothetical protein
MVRERWRRWQKRAIPDAMRAHAGNFAQGMAVEPHYAEFAAPVPNVFDPNLTAMDENAAPEMEIEPQDADSDDPAAKMFVPP